MAFATRHNGGLSQTNFHFLQTGGEYPFINCLKTAQSWTYGNDTAQPLPSELDANGYPLAGIGNGGVYTRFFVPRQADLPGNYKVTWTGNGTISKVTAVVGNTSTSGFEFTPASNGDVNLGISSVGSPGISDLKVYHVSHQSLIDAGEIFHPKLKARLAEANFGVYRFLNWQSGNTSLATTWNSLKPTSYVFYHGYELRSNIYAGSASLSGVNYSVSAPANTVDGTAWAGLTDKTTVHVRFATARPALSSTFSNGSSDITITAHGLAVHDRLRFNRADDSSVIPTNFVVDTNYYVVSAPDANTIRVSATQGGSAIVAGSAQTGVIYCAPWLYLNVGSTGAKKILSKYSNDLSFGGNSYPVTGQTATVVYDQTLDAWIKQGGDSGSGTAGIDNGMPPALGLQLCAEMGAHPWFVSPCFSMDPLTDLMPTLATYCRDNQPSWMKPLFEGPNELWNYLFAHTTYGDNKAAAYGWANGYHAWCGKISSVLGQAISTVYSNDRSKYDVVVGVQTSGHPPDNTPRLESTAYVNQIPAAQSPYLKDPACNWVTAVCVAQYWNSSFYTDAQETAMATAYVNAAASEKANMRDVYIKGALISGSRADSLPQLTTRYAAWKAWVLGVSNPVRQMIGYEGCYTPDYVGPADSDAFRYACKLSPDTGTQTIAVYNSFTKLSDDTFTAKYPSNYFLGDFTINSASAFAWAIFMGDIYAATTPQWDAICRYNQVRRSTNLRILMHS